MANPVSLREIQEYLEQNDVQALRRFCESVHPGVSAEILAGLGPEEIRRILLMVDFPLRAEIFRHLGKELQQEMVEVFDRKELADLISHMPPDDRVDLLKRVPDEMREAVMRIVAQAEREDIRRLSAYREGTAGAVMTSDYATLSPDLTVAQALDKLRREAPDKETIYYAYVIDQERRLQGFVSLKDLILSPPSTCIADLMHREVIRAWVDDDQEEAARTIQKYDLIALPVVDGGDALVGTITHDDALDIITQEHTEDLEKFMAISGSHEAGVYLKTPAWVHFKNRALWIVGLAALGLISGMVIRSFEDTLMHLMILALYMPMVADTGGNTGSQSATVVVRALALGEITPRDTLRVLGKEFQVAVMLAVILGVLSWGKVLFLSQGTHVPHSCGLGVVALTIALALGMQVVTATLIGAVLPLAAARFNLDPAVVASPALTTIVDITGLFLYFMTAKWLLGI